jgi:hypothetical protein
MGYGVFVVSMPLAVRFPLGIGEKGAGDMGSEGRDVGTPVDVALADMGDGLCDIIHCLRGDV